MERGWEREEGLRGEWEWVRKGGERERKRVEEEEEEEEREEGGEEG